MSILSTPMSILSTAMSWLSTSMSIESRLPIKNGEVKK